MTRPISARENFQRLMQRKHPLWLPLDLPMTSPVRDELERRRFTRDARRAFDLDFAHVGVRLADTSPQWRKALELLGARLPSNAVCSSLGFAHVSPPAGDLGNAYHLTSMLHPLECVTSVDQLQSLPWPDVSSREAYKHLPRQVEELHRQGLAVHGGMECTVFEFSWYARGMDNLFCDLAEGNGIADWLLDWNTQRSVHAATHFAQAGVDCIGLGDDIGTQRGMMLSPQTWREHLKPRLQRVIDAIRANQSRHIWIKYHSDGDIRDVLDELIDMGVDIINPVQPECMPAEEVIGRYQDRAAFWGLIGTQKTMPFGSTEDVRQAVARCANWSRDGACIIIAPTHVLEPDVPWANIEALVDAAKATQLTWVSQSSA